MTDARFDWLRTSEARGEYTPATDDNATATQVAKVHPWNDISPRRTDAPLLVHWIDEKGSVVRLISSASAPVDTPPS